MSEEFSNLNMSFLRQQGSGESSTNTVFVAWPARYNLFWSAYIPSQFYLFTYVFKFKHVCICFFPTVSHLSIPVCSHRLSRATMDRHQKGQSHYIDVQITTLVPIRLPAYTHVCSFLFHKIYATQFGLYGPLTSTEVRKRLVHLTAVALKP